MKSNGLVLIVWALISITHFSCTLGKAYPNLVAPTSQYFESLCNNETNNERFVESDGRRSSFFLDLHSNALMRRKFCERNFTTSESHGFMIRLIIAKNKFVSVTQRDGGSSGSGSGSSNSNSNSNSMLNSQRNHGGKTLSFKNLPGNQHAGSKYHAMTNSQNNKNATRSCPITVYSNMDDSYNDVLWRIDPCEIEREDNGNENNWPAKIFEGHIKIRWEHNYNSITSKLMITSLGKGEECKKSNKFPCLTWGNGALFCISKDLVCDGIRHCPNGNSYEDDENKKTCEQFYMPSILSAPSVIFDNEWEQQLMLWMKHTFGDLALSTSQLSSSDFSAFDNINDKELHDGRPSVLSGDKPHQSGGNGFNSQNNDSAEKKATATITTRKNSAKNTLTGDLSKYGPWGYLMLGMLLCGGALLICGLWECCCRKNKNESHITASTMVGGSATIQDTAEISASRNQNNLTPPNYDELDPPPPYSVLFPNQKATSSIESLSQRQESQQLPPAAPGVRESALVTVPVVVVVPGGARLNNNTNTNSNSSNSNNNTITNDLTSTSSS